MARPRRVMHVVHSLNLGGAERLASQLAMSLSDEFEIIVACIDEAGFWASEVRGGGIPVIELHRQPGIDLTVAWKLAALARRHNVGLLHAHQYSPYFYTVLSRVMAPRANLLFHEHGRHYPEIESPKRVAVNKYVFNHFTTHVVAVSADVLERVVRYEGLPRSKIEVVYNGTKAPPPADRETKNEIRRHLGLAPDHIVAGTVGRLDPVKNVPLALGSLAALRQDYPNLRLLVIGDGPARETIESTARDLGLTDLVVMPGFRNDASELVRAMDIFLLPSLTEGTSLALVGAMAAEIPAVASAVGGTPEVIEHERNGLLIESEDQEGLTAAIKRLIDHPDEAAALGVAGRKTYLEGFTYDGMISAFRTIYRKMLR